MRDALANNDIPYVLVYPDIDLKDEYLNRYVKRGSPESFVKLLSSNWDSWLKEMETQEGCFEYCLKKGEFLSDII